MATLKIPVTSADHRAGLENAPVTLVEYGDYECPHCGRAHPIVQKVRRHFGDRLRFVFRNFPLNESHPNAEAAAEVAEFAGARAKFWEMHDLLFENQSRFSGPVFVELAESLGLREAELIQEVNDGLYRDRVRADFEGGIRSGVNGTPSFFINGVRHDDSFDFDTLAAAIDEASRKAR
jgi:protein-disulfide isomerase